MIAHGACPHCGTRVEVARPERQRCSACGGEFLSVWPEEPEGEAPGELEVQLLPHGFDAPRRGGSEVPRRGSFEAPWRTWLASRGLSRPFLVWLKAAGIGIVLAFGLGLALAVFASKPKSGLALILLALLLVFALPFAALCASPVVRILVGRRDVRAHWSSALAVALGAVVLAAGTFFWPVVLAPIVPASRATALFVMLLIGIPPGWITVRLARAQPYRHALAVGLVYVLGFALALSAVSRFSRPDLLAGVLIYLIYVPLLLVGAWLRVRQVATS